MKNGLLTANAVRPRKQYAGSCYRRTRRARRDDGHPRVPKL